MVSARRGTRLLARKRTPAPSRATPKPKVDVVFYGLADGDQDLYIDVRVACAESHEVGFKEAIAAAEKIKTDKYAREVAGISQSAFLPFVVGSHGGLGTCAKQVWALLVQRAKLVAARDWRQSWSAMTYQQVWLRRLSVAIAKQEAIATLVRVPLVTRRQAAVGVAVFGEGEGGEGGGACGIRGCACRCSWILETVAAEARCRCLRLFRVRELAGKGCSASEPHH